MRLLVVTQYFWPETFIINDLVRKLEGMQLDVVVVTGKPNYPDGELFPGYKKSGIQHETFGSNVDVWRVPLHPRGRGGAWNLLRNYLSFVWSGVFRFPYLLRAYEFDAILVYAPSPITAVVPAIALKLQKRAHLALWVQDLWPDSLAATGFVRNALLLRIAGWLVRCLYACCDTLLVPSHAFMKHVAKYASMGKITYYPNSIDFNCEPNYSSARDENGELSDSECKSVGGLPDHLREILDDQFCIVFAGNVGKAQAIESLVEAALLLQDRTEVKIIVVGSGSMLDWLRERKETLRLNNLVLTGRYPMSVMPELFHRAKGLLVSLKDEEIFSCTIPSKVQAYLASGRPVVAALNGEGARVIREANAGLICAAEDSEGLAGCILSLYEMTEEQRRLMGESGRAYFHKHFEMNQQAKRLIAILQDRIYASRSSAESKG